MSNGVELKPTSGWKPEVTNVNFVTVTTEDIKYYSHTISRHALIYSNLKDFIPDCCNLNQWEVELCRLGYTLHNKEADLAQKQEHQKVENCQEKLNHMWVVVEELSQEHWPSNY